jgi:hypothetical protein
MRAACARPFGLFLHPLAAPQGPHFGGILPQKQRQSRGRPKREWKLGASKGNQNGFPLARG